MGTQQRQAGELPSPRAWLQRIGSCSRGSWLQGWEADLQPGKCRVPWKDVNIIKQQRSGMEWTSTCPMLWWGVLLSKNYRSINNTTASTTHNTCPASAVCDQGGLQTHHPLNGYLSSVSLPFSLQTDVGSWKWYELRGWNWDPGLSDSLNCSTSKATPHHATLGMQKSSQA